MELQGEDGSVVELCERGEKVLGRGPGFAPHDRTVSRRQVRLQVQRIASSTNHFRFSVSIDVIGPNPICVVHSNVGGGGNDGVEIAKSGTQSLLEIGEKFSLSIQKPIFYTLHEPVANVGLGPHRSGESEPRRNGSGKLGHDQSDVKDRRDGGKNAGIEAGIAAADPDEEEGIAEAVARWQRRKQERLQVEQRRSIQEGGAIGDTVGDEVGGERKQGEGIFSEQELVFSEHDPPEANKPELTDGPRADQDDADVVKEFGFIVEGSEFERYGKKALDTSKWDWQIGRRPANESDEDEEEEEEGRKQVSQDQTRKRNRIAAGSKANQKAKCANGSDDDEWRGDSEGENDQLSAGKRPVSREKNVHTRSHDFATSSETISEPRKKRQLISTSEYGPDIKSKSPEQGNTRLNTRQATASKSTKKSTKRRPRAKKEEEDDDDDDGEDLDGFLVDDDEEEDESEAADDEDEWTDEDEDEEVEEDDEIDPGKGKRNVQRAGHSPAPSRPAKDDELDRGDDKPLCKYGSKCFRKNKDHLAQFRH